MYVTKRALDFAAKLNSRDIQNCNCFWVPSYGLFSSARKAVGSFSNDDGDKNVDKERRMFLSLSKLESGPQEINSRATFRIFSELK